MTRDELLAGLPPVPSDDLQPAIREALESSGRTIVVLDDDPTGTQTVFDVPVLTRLDADSIRDALEETPPVLYLLTNSRALSPGETTALHRELGLTLKPFLDDLIIISRSDSTLRGHFPLEPDVLRETLDLPEAPTLFIPFFEAGGRLTVGDTHYVVEGQETTPAHLTPFAQDNAFPFSHSFLPDYFREKSGEAVEVASLSIEDLRCGGVSEKLEALPSSATCIVNATTLRDLDALSLALHQSDRRFLIRSAASFVQTLAGIVPRPPLEPWQMQDLEPNDHGGLVVVGSHVPKTTAQLNHLIANIPGLAQIEVSVPDVINGEFEIDRLIRDLEQKLSSGKTVVLSTSRERFDGDDNLAIANRVSGVLVDIVRGLTCRPSFFLAKGGITSSDLATKALEVTKAMVLGQILPGVPVWTLGPEARHPGLSYVVFPGNVGGDDALTQAVRKLQVS